MFVNELWKSLKINPYSGWLSPVDIERSGLTQIDSECRVIWVGIGGSLLPADLLVRTFASSDQLTRWITLASPESLKGFRLQIDDQVVIASKSGNTLEIWFWIGKLLSMPLF